MDVSAQENTKETVAVEVEEIISFKEFLERTHPSVSKPVREFWEVIPRIGKTDSRKLTFPDIRLHCQQCEGERTFRCLGDVINLDWQPSVINRHPIYRCGDCQEFVKVYALRISFDENEGGKIYKYGEFPPFGIPVPNRLLRLFGRADSELFLKGRQCENLGYGIAAFAYYRRVVENHKNDLFSEIIKVCETVGASDELIRELEAAKSEISFSKSMAKIKTGLPEGLLIGGHNPLNALHGALSVGLHNERDEDCLADAQAVRLVLGDLVDRIAQLKQENKQLSDAVQRLLLKKS